MIWSLPGDFPVFSAAGEHMSHYLGEAHSLMADAPDMVYASIPQDEAKANAAFIVRAVNNHDALKMALTECAKRFETAAIHSGTDPEMAAEAVKQYRDLVAAA